MNPTGYRFEEKKTVDPEPSFYSNKNKSFDSRSHSSYKSTQSSRSSVLQRAREYNRRIEEQQLKQSTPAKIENQSPEDLYNRRSKSLERRSNASGSYSAGQSPRSLSASRAEQQSFDGVSPVVASNRPSTRERALASVRKESNFINPTSSHHSAKTLDHNRNKTGPLLSPSTPSTSLYTTSNSSATRSSQITATTQSHTPSQQQSVRKTMSRDNAAIKNDSRQANTLVVSQGSPFNGKSGDSYQINRVGEKRGADSPARSMKSGATTAAQSQAPLDQQQPIQQQPVVTPELLVDALSGHEDGLLAIAEKLMEHYDSGYDVMGEAIIDAFADVQKLFQHVVEAAHMEGAAFEASRREEELAELRRQAAAGGAAAADLIASGLYDDPSLLLASSQNPDTSLNISRNNTSTSPGGPSRHDEFIDQDVKDILTEAIRQGSILRGEKKNKECYELFEKACQDASSLLPVDSDHRGRLQLSLARAESMSPDRGCAILRYAMDDVLRSGMRAHRTPLPDPSKRADVVLTRPRGHPSLTGASGQVMAGVIQSSDEALASLLEEMKEILSAPIYHDTPLQNVAKRFWTALNDSQKIQQKNEERLEQSLGKLKAEFLLARAEWEEKLSKASELAESYKQKYTKLKESRKNERYMEQARSFATKGSSEDERHPHDMAAIYGSMRFGVQEKAGSVVSGVSGLAQHAKTIVSQMNQFNCAGLNDRNGSVFDEDDDDDDDDGGQEESTLGELDSRYDSKDRHHPPLSQRSQDSTSTSSTPQQHRSRSHTKVNRSFSKSPKRVDI